MRILSSQLRAQVVKEMLSVWRDVRVRMTLIAPPLMQLLIFSFAATLEVRNVTVAILDRDGGHWSEQFIADLAASSFVGHVLTVPDRAAMNSTIEQRQALLAVDIPETFSRDGHGCRTAGARIPGRSRWGILRRSRSDSRRSRKPRSRRTRLPCAIGSIRT